VVFIFIVQGDGAIIMPKGTKVYKCVHDLIKKGRSKVSAIRICQKSTGMSYKTGEKSKVLHRVAQQKKPR